MKKTAIEAINAKLTPEQADAIGVLEGSGFLAFTDAKLEDVRELSTGRRMRTFRNQGRYGLVLALKSDQGLTDGSTVPQEPVRLPTLEEMSVEMLRAEAKTYPDIDRISGKKKDELLAEVGAAREKREVLFRDYHES